MKITGKFKHFDEVGRYAGYDEVAVELQLSDEEKALLVAGGVAAANPGHETRTIAGRASLLVDALTR